MAAEKSYIPKMMTVLLSLLMMVSVVLGSTVTSSAATRKFYIPKTFTKETETEENPITGTTSYDPRFQRLDCNDFSEDELFLSLINESTDSTNNRFLGYALQGNEGIFTNDSIRLGKIKEIDFYETTSDGNGKDLKDKHFFNVKNDKLMSHTISDRQDYGGSVIYNYSYNSKGDLIQITEQDVTNFGFSQTSKISITYDSKGRVSKIETLLTNSDGEAKTDTQQFSSYTKDGFPTMEGKTTNRTYNANGQVIKLMLSYPSDEMYNLFTYDSIGHLTQTADYSVGMEGERMKPDITHYSDYYAI